MKFVDCYTNNKVNWVLCDSVIVLNDYLVNGNKNPNFNYVYPDRDNKSSIQVQAFEILNLFGIEFRNAINDYFESNYSKTYLLDLFEAYAPGSANAILSDPFAIIFYVVSNQKPSIRDILRLPFRETVSSKDMKSFLDNLDNIRETRNYWFHFNVEPTFEELTFILKQIALFCQLLEIPFGSITTIEKLAKDELSFGASPESEFDTFTYTLRLNGGVTDRASDNLLSDVIEPEKAKQVGEGLLEVKPGGGRIKVINTEVSRLLYAWGDFDKNGEHRWGFIKSINRTDWFR